jgi:hypothetical protein
MTAIGKGFKAGPAKCWCGLLLLGNQYKSPTSFQTMYFLLAVLPCLCLFQVTDAVPGAEQTLPLAEWMNG